MEIRETRQNAGDEPASNGSVGFEEREVRQHDQQRHWDVVLDVMCIPDASGATAMSTAAVTPAVRPPTLRPSAYVAMTVMTPHTTVNIRPAV